MKLGLPYEARAIQQWPIVRVGRTSWQNVLRLLLIDLALCAAAIVPLLVLALGLPVLAPIVAAFTLGPLWMGVCQVGGRLLDGEETTFREFLRASRRYGWRGVRMALVPAVLVSALYGTWVIVQANPQESWLYLSLFIDGSATVLALMAAGVAFPLAWVSELRGWSLWKAAFLLVARRPLAALCALGLLVVLAFWFSSGLLPLLAAPLGLYQVALTRDILSRSNVVKVG